MNRVCLSLAFGIFALASLATAGDWPQILGPSRNGIAQNESLSPTWPKEGLKVTWSKQVGDGFAGVAVSKDKAIVFHRVDDEEVVEAVDAATGKPQWKASWKATYVPSFTDDSGPRVVPLIHENSAYLFGAGGMLACVKLSDGKLVWLRDLLAEYKNRRPKRGEPPEGYFGFGTSPLIADGKLLLNVGDDENNAGIAAFDLATGKTLWKATSERSSYSSPVIAKQNGKSIVVFATRLKIVGLEPETGKVLFEHPFGRLGPAVTGANPVVTSNGLQFFISASYGFGAAFHDLSQNGAPEIWNSDEVLSSQYTTSIPHHAHLFGVHGRQDIGNAELRCVDPVRRLVKWKEPDFGYASLIMADEKLLALKTNGELVLAPVSLTEFKPTASASLFDKTTRALPALSNGRFYARDSRTLKCFELPKR